MLAADGLKPPIFLLGNVRSGTTMMQEIFGLHPEIVTWFEPRTIWVYAAPRRRHDRFTEADASPPVIRYIRRRFLRYQRQHEDRRIMEKTPSNILRIPYVDKIFPEARYLYLVRNPLDQLTSSEAKWQEAIHPDKAWRRIKETPKMQLPYYAGRLAWDHFSKRVLKRKYVSVWGVRYLGIYDDLRRLDVAEVIAKQWDVCSRQAEKDLSKLDGDRVIRMRYEDFVADPIPAFQRIAGHFSLEIGPSVLEEVRKMVDGTRRERWRRFDAQRIQKCLPILESEMARHGYSVPQPCDLAS